MKRILVLPLAIFYCITFGQSTNNNIISINPNVKVNVYRFKNKLLDLYKLKFIDTTLTKNYTEIKREDIHAGMFSKNPNSNKVIYKNYYFELKENRDVSISNSNGKLIKTISDPDKNILADNISGNSTIFSVSTGVVVAIRLNEENGYHIKKYDEKGNTLNIWKIAHTIYNKKDNEIESIPFLYYFAHTDNAMIFSSMHHSKAQSTIIMSLNDSTRIKTDKSTGGIIVNPKDNSLAGIISFSDKSMEVNMGTKSWNSINEGWGDAAKTVLNDSILVIARYHNIATGCSVNAYNVNTGNLLWKGDVKQLNVGHSKYYNIVHLTLFENKLILEGNEAYGDYLQVLDLNTGKNLFTEMPVNK